MKEVMDHVGNHVILVPHGTLALKFSDYEQWNANLVFVHLS